MKNTTLLSLLSIAALAACGGAQKTGGGASGGGGGDTGGDTDGGAKPANNSDIAGDVSKSKEPERKISKDEKADYNNAYQAFMGNEKSGWSESACRQTAERFESVAREHSQLVEASFMAGLSYHRCNLWGDAEKAYRKALSIKSNHPQTLSNLGAVYLSQGKTGQGYQFAAQAVQASAKISAGHVNNANKLMVELRTTAPGPAWNKLADDISYSLSSALAIDSTDVRTYVAYGQFYLEGSDRNKNRLDLAKLLLDEGEKLDAKNAALKNTRGLLFMKRNNLSEALKQFQAAVELDPSFLEARMNVGLVTLGFRKFDTSKEQFTKVLAKQPNNYDAIIGLGVALRGLGDFDGAEAQYKKAKSVDGQRGEAAFNLGVLYKDFKAAKQADLKQGVVAYQTAKGFFNEFLSKKGSDADKAEAKENIAVIDKNVKMMESFIKAQAAAGAGGATP